MITREDIRELAQFYGDAKNCAISFYFQPSKPRNKLHREDAILAKDLVRQALREAEKSGRNGCARADLQRIFDLAARWSGNQARAKAVFACGGSQIWREFDLPAQLAERPAVRQSPLSPEAAGSGSGWPAAPVHGVVDRHRARFFDLHLDELKEREALFRPSPGAVAATGLRVTTPATLSVTLNDEILHHFKNVAEYLQTGSGKGSLRQSHHRMPGHQLD